MRSRVAAVALLAILPACSRPASGPNGSASPSVAADLDRPLPSPLPDVVARVNGQPIDIRQILPLAKVELDKVSVPDRDRLKAGIVRRALQKYVDRELLLQEALARGVHVDSREVDWAYDQMRREHSDDAKWAEFLAGQGMDPASVRTELRAQHTLASLLRLEQTGGAGGQPLEEVQAALVARLRAKARIELLI
jgi:hypothetical protein